VKRAGPAIIGMRLAIVAAAVLVAAVGAASSLRARAARAPVVETATIGGITATPHVASWVSMHQAMDGRQMDGMHDQRGYRMPAQMMPGAPADGDMRLGVPVTLMNSSGQVREFNLAGEFSLVGGHDDGARPLNSDTFGELTRLHPGSAVDGVLYFDLKPPVPGDPPLYLKWTRAGSHDRLTVRVAGAPSGHAHGS
jgi:hypothetical protein